jgi:hypothetical protein
MGSNKGHFSLIASIDAPKSYSMKCSRTRSVRFFAYESSAVPPYAFSDRSQKPEGRKEISGISRSSRLKFLRATGDLNAIREITEEKQMYDAREKASLDIQSYLIDARQ